MEDAPERSARGPRPLEDLARRLAAGDRNAFDEAHARLDGGVRRLFQRRGASAEAAEELSQRTWLEVWRVVTQGRYRPERSAISTFVYAVAGFVGRRRTGAQGLALPAQLGERLADPDAGIEQALAEAEVIEATRACLKATTGQNALSESEREAVLATLEGQSERQAAERLSVSASTINARKKSAFDKIRRCLAAKGFFDAERGGPHGE